MDCETVDRHVGAFVDGELDGRSVLDIEDHLISCEVCDERVAFELASRELIREAMTAESASDNGRAAPAGLSDRLRNALDEEDSNVTSLDSRRDELSNWRPGWRVVPAAAAAAVVIFAGSAYLAQSETSEAALADVVRVHSADLPSDVRLSEAQSRDDQHDDAAATARVAHWFEGKVGFPVRPAEFERRDVRLVGARVSNVRERQAAALYYMVDGRRMTVVVTDQSVGGADEVQVNGQRLRYEQVSGHNIPVREAAGLSYAFTGDVDRDTLLHLAASARVP